MTFLCVARRCSSVTGFSPRAPVLVETIEPEEHAHLIWSHLKHFEAQCEDSWGKLLYVWCGLDLLTSAKSNNTNKTVACGTVGF